MMANKLREAATVILLALRPKPYRTPYNYYVSTLKRSDKQSFMPNGYVFPGGAVSNSDASLNWLNLFEKCNVSSKELLATFCHHENLPPLFKNTNPEVLPREISLRITALRETFEETGILLCRKKNTEINNEEIWAHCFESTELEAWQKKVENDANDFLTMCESLECIPDLWGLKLWSNWLTPTTLTKRYDTAFFTACLPEEPIVHVDGTENEKHVWFSPEQLLLASKNRQIWLPPPQTYEVSRMLPFFMLDDLAHFASERQALGCEAFCPHHFKTKEGSILTLPGDSLYNEEDSGKYSNSSFEELRKISNRMHRIEDIPKKQIKFLLSNVTPRYGHILPLTAEESKI